MPPRPNNESPPRLRPIASMSLSIEKYSYPPVPPPMHKVSMDGCALPEKSGIYFVWDNSGPAYIGKSRNMAQRCKINTHGNIFPGDAVSFIEFEEGELDFAECFYIGFCRPHRNFGGWRNLPQFSNDLRIGGYSQRFVRKQARLRPGGPARHSPQGDGGLTTHPLMMKPSPQSEAVPAGTMAAMSQPGINTGPSDGCESVPAKAGGCGFEPHSRPLLQKDDHKTANLLRENNELRTMCALAHAGMALYHDDGELQDSRAQPWIDWRRDSVTDIQTKLAVRAMRQVEEEWRILELHESAQNMTSDQASRLALIRRIYGNNRKLTGPNGPV